MASGDIPAPSFEFYSKEFLIKHIEDIVKFYAPRVKDPAGGFFQSFKVNGDNFDDNFQQIVSSARMVINFFIAGKILKRDDLLDLGRHGLEYLEKGHWVEEKGGYAFTMRDHKPDDMTQQSYAWAFVLAAHAASILSGASTDTTRINAVFDLMEERFYLPEAGAYADTIFDNGVLDDYRGMNSNMHICEGMIAAYEATKDKKYLDRAIVLVKTFTQTLAGKANGLLWEHYTKEWEVDWEYNRNDPSNIYRAWGFQPGHQIEWSKNLLNIYRYQPEEWMVVKAQELFDRSYDVCWDTEFGGLIYGIDDKEKWLFPEKYFWVQGESIATSALLHQATGKAVYKERNEALWKYAWEHWVDHQHGAWKGFKMSRDNKLVDDVKACAGAKCDYHTLIACAEALKAFGAHPAQ